MARSATRILLRTPRLTMREFAAADFDDLLRLDSDPRVLKYINGGKPMARAEVEAALQRVTRYYALYPGLGVWRASRRDNGAFVGWYCLKYCPPTTDVEVGYRLLFDAWGKGFATEGARALLDYGFTDLGVTRIIGVANRVVSDEDVTRVADQLKVAEVFSVPEDPAVEHADQLGVAPMDADPDSPAMAAVRELADLLVK